ncbi:MAG: hypothetical protein KGL16_03300, partial [Acidobacteriota bacterium]|nr:hypothetical protein [Acidobacteriota bacterium]
PLAEPTGLDSTINGVALAARACVEASAAGAVLTAATATAAPTASAPLAACNDLLLSIRFIERAPPPFGT